MILNSNSRKIATILKNFGELTITGIVDKSKLSRTTVRITLAEMEGANDVFLRKFGMAKVYSLKKSEKNGI